jgi:anti-sigma factor RsiW
MAITNRDRISRALDYLRDGLTPFVEQELEAHLGAVWQARVNQSRRFDIPCDEYGAFKWDSLSLLRTMFRFWNEVFKFSLSHAERSFVSELMTIRNEFAHENQFSSDDTYRALDTAGRLLVSVAAPEEAAAINAMRQELLRSVFDENRMSPSTANAGEGVDVRHAIASGRHSVDPISDDLTGVDAEARLEFHQQYEGEDAIRRNPEAIFGAMADLPSLPFALTVSETATYGDRNSANPRRRSRALSVMVLFTVLTIGVLGGFAFQTVGTAINSPHAIRATVIEDHWLHEFADYFLIFAEDDMRVVELGPERKNLLESWFGKRLGRSVQVADLSHHGAEFKGGRLIPVEGQATALFVYQSGDGHLFSVAVTRSWNENERGRAAVRKSGLDMVYWARAGMAFVVMGRFDPATLDRISRDLEKHFEKI